MRKKFWTAARKWENRIGMGLVGAAVAGALIGQLICYCGKQIAEEIDSKPATVYRFVGE